MQLQRKFISRFSPNRTDPEDLERINVQRQDLLERSVAVLRASALTQNKHHLLFVGPRGCGKTHLLALICHRLQHQADLDGRLRIAWLNEDETSTSFLDLLLRIQRALADRYPAEFPVGDIEQLSGRDRAEALELLGRILVSRIGQRTVLVLVENLDTLFRQLDESDQRAWRAFVQNHPVFATAATAQSLFAGVSERDQPFFGFFDTNHLQPLAADEAVELLQRVAQLNQDGALTEFLGTPRGKARVQAINYLSGGNHRLYIALSDFITRESLDELVRPFEQMVDEQLTPYYQERLRWLSPQQRKIVEFLCLRARPAAVKEIAAALFAEHSSIASQLQKLREMGYVRPNPRGRESLYELAEPLMRLSMEVKKTGSHQPLRLIVDFLRVWFERSDLERLSTHCDTAGLALKYLSAALEELQPGQPDLRRELLLQGIEDLDIEHCNLDQLERLRLLAADSSDPGDWAKYALGCCRHKRFPEAIEWFGRVVELPGVSVEQVAWALVNRGACLGIMGRAEEAIAEFTRSVELPNAPAKAVANAIFNRGISLGVLGRAKEAIADYTRAMESGCLGTENLTLTLLNRGLTFGRMGQARVAVADFTRIVDLPKAPAGLVAMALSNRGIAFGQMGRTQDAIADYTRAITLPGAPVEQVALAFVNRGASFGVLGRTEDEIRDYTQVIELPGAPVGQVAKALVNRGFRLGFLGRTAEAISDCTRAIELPGAPVEQVAKALVHRGIRLGIKGCTEESIADCTRAVELPGAPAEGVARALVNRGFGLGVLGRIEEAIADYTRAIELPGAPVEQVTLALLNRSLTLGRMGQTQAAVADFTRIINLPDTPAEQVAQALYNRGVAFDQMGRTQDAVADYTGAIQLPGVAPESVARALFLRALAFGKMGREQDAIGDLTRAIELPGVPSEQAARALIARGTTLGRLSRTPEAKGDFLRALELPGTQAQTVATARGAVAFAMFATGEWNSAVVHLADFLAAPQKPAPVIAQVSKALIQAIFGQIGSPDVWQMRVAQVVALFREYNALVYLGGALVQHLGSLKEGPLSDVGLNQWLAVWEARASGNTAMRFSLGLLRAGIAYLKTEPRDEGVLLQLPSEERSLVRLALGLAEKPLE